MTNPGEAIIDAVIRAQAVLYAVPHDDESFTFVWNYNASEQIEAALAKAGWTLVRTDQQP